MSDYKTPFQVKESVIYDADGRKVKLWGVNYYTPFNSNFYNIEELGKDHFAAIDEDIRHFKLMNIDFIRMHLYDREITDREGNIVENKNMQVFDHLLTQCEKNGIYLMLTPTVWWNTVSNQIFQDTMPTGRSTRRRRSDSPTTSPATRCCGIPKRSAVRRPICTRCSPGGARPTENG